MTRAPYRVHQLIQDIWADADTAAQFRADPEPVFEAYGLEEREKALLRNGEHPALIKLGVHPNLQVKYLRITAEPETAQEGPLAHYLARMQKE